MNTTVKALQDLYVTLGGALTDTYADIADGEQVGNYVTIPDVIEACAQKGGTVHVPFTVSDGTATTTATFEDVQAAAVAGKPLVADVSVNGIAIIAPLTAKNPDTNPTALVFGTVATIGEGKPTLYQIAFSASGSTVSVTELT